MARKPRDHKAENAARNKRSREAGFKSRADERAKRKASKEWSRKHAKSKVAYYHDGWKAERVKAYHAAFVAKDTGFQSFTRSKRTDEAARNWLVDVTGHMTEDEYDERYTVR